MQARYNTLFHYAAPGALNGRVTFPRSDYPVSTIHYTLPFNTDTVLASYVTMELVIHSYLILGSTNKQH